MKPRDKAGDHSNFAGGGLPAFMLLVLLAVVMNSCPNPADWYPSGTITLAGYYEFESAGTKSVYATVLISNTGGSVISRSTFGVSAITDGGRYYSTAVSDIRILPNEAIWTTVALEYANPLECLIEYGVSILHGFFE